ncbi:MAG: CBS domain-containing protein [Chitinophagaceae bacterium]|jgi:CBS domain-containing protein
MKKIADIFKRKGTNNIVISPDEPVLNALKIMAEKNIGSVVVMNGQQYMGLITERDYARKVILHGKSSSDLTVGEIMSSFLPKASLQSTMEECMEVMTNHNIRYLPVFEEDTYIGVVSIIDVVKETIHAQKNTIEDLQNYINFAG